MTHVVNGLEEARAALRNYGAGRAAGSCSPPAGEPNRTCDLVGGKKARLTEYAREMLKEPTPWEQKLWQLLRSQQLADYKFRRQVPVDHYIVDFVNYEKRLIVELDGSQHMDSGYDKTRDDYLRAQGFSVLRFWNNALDGNPNGILEQILEVLKNTPHRRPQEGVDSPAGGEYQKTDASTSEIIQLESPPYAACHAGVNYYRALVAQLRAEFPDVPFTFTLCCGDDPAIAHDAVRLGFTHIRCDVSAAMRAQLQAMGAMIS